MITATHKTRALIVLTCVSLAFTALSELASAHNLSVYDAAYLELALRLGLPLATLDRPLRVREVLATE